MTTHVAQGYLTDLLEPARIKLRRRLERSERLRLALLLLGNAAGALLMLSPLLLLAAAGGTMAWLSVNIQGPLDWFLLELSGALALFGAFLSVQLLFLRPAAPAGVPVSEQHAPELTAMVERRIAHFRAAPLDDIVLVPEATLELRATPAWPFPFMHRFTLCLGAPLMCFISPGQFRLALAGSIAAGASLQHGLSGWALQASRDWPLILETLESRRLLAARLLRKPLRLIAALSTGLAREADAEQRQLPVHWIRDNGDEASAGACLAGGIVARAYLADHYWPMIYKAAERCPAPVVKPFSHFGLLLEKTLNDRSAQQWLLQAQSGTEAESGVKDLLATLGIDYLRWQGLPASSALAAVFPAGEILRDLDRHWQASIQDEWKRCYDGFQGEKKRFERLQARWQREGLDGRSALRFIKLATRFLDAKQAVGILSDVYQANPNDAGICFNCGREMLRFGFVQAGCEALQRAAELDKALSNQAHALISEHRGNDGAPATAGSHGGGFFATALSKAS